MAAVSQTQTSPLPQSLASRGRRPALIPHNADLSVSLSAASAALGMASYSPNRERQRSGGVLWVVPGSAPPLPPPPQWDSQGQSRGRKNTAEWDQDAMDVDYDDDDDGHDERVERELVRGLVAKDVFSWVNSTDAENDQVYSVTSRSGGKNINAASGSDTAPTSPLSGNFPEQLEFRRRRLEEAARDNAGRK
ncbi:hypothetical protein L873DRAFT_1825322 [Choiromyces venosus 120613-1]|uniref:Uncharacterized protein n=1 Tax=Choiromyces venosus 120613-1 TaxID=1336337 RepID=A0A3N4K3K3_9PEZI|nr:hypothetical protein L873DRAFT_1825322 [Choiromyces venosus 120613-1]